MIAWTIYTTFAGALVALLLPRVFAKWAALVTSVAGLAISLAVFFRTKVVDLAHFKTVVRVPGVPVLGMNYHLALDGLSLLLVLVTGNAVGASVLLSWS